MTGHPQDRDERTTVAYWTALARRNWLINAIAFAVGAAVPLVWRHFA